MITDAVTRSEAENLPAFEDGTEHEIGARYLWRDFTDSDHAFFVRPVADPLAVRYTFGQSPCPHSPFPLPVRRVSSSRAMLKPPCTGPRWGVCP